MTTPLTARRGLAAALAVALLATGCGGGPAPDTSRSATEQAGSRLGEPEVVTTRLDAPWSIAFHGDTPLISERDSGRLLALEPDGTQVEVARVPGVDGIREGGLLGITVHERYLYAYFTAGDENRVARYPLTGSGTDLDLGPGEPIFGGIPAAAIHNGGRIAFGPDGMLYITAGDVSDGANAQDLGSPAGKILRLTPDGTIPEDNPFDGSPVYSYGHRNSQGLAWAEDGTLYASEFGQNTWDELNVIELGGNYGWPEVEGKGGGGEYIDPVQQWRPAEASPSGMTIVSDTIYMANLRGKRLREIPVAEPGTATEHYVEEYGRLRDAARAPDGSLWVLTNNTDGHGIPGPDDDRVLRIDPSA